MNHARLSPEAGEGVFALCLEELRQAPWSAMRAPSAMETAVLVWRRLVREDLQPALDAPTPEAFDEAFRSRIHPFTLKVIAITELGRSMPSEDGLDEAAAAPVMVAAKEYGGEEWAEPLARGLRSFARTQRVIERLPDEPLDPEEAVQLVLACAHWLSWLFAVYAMLALWEGNTASATVREHIRTLLHREPRAMFSAFRAVELDLRGRQGTLDAPPPGEPSGPDLAELQELEEAAHTEAARLLAEDAT